MVVDDCSAWRLYLRALMEIIPGFEIVADAGDGLEAVEKATQLRPDILLLDIGLPFLNGIRAAEAIRVSSPDTKIFFVTQEQDEDIRNAALATGAEGYVVKSNAASELMMTVEAALRRDVYPGQRAEPRAITAY